jgi:hypothetical protein
MVGSYSVFTNRQLVYIVGAMNPVTQTPTAQAPEVPATLLPRTTARLRHGDVAYVDHGDRDLPAALFVHGVLVNADLWHNVI